MSGLTAHLQIAGEPSPEIPEKSRRSFGTKDSGVKWGLPLLPRLFWRHVITLEMNVLYYHSLETRELLFRWSFVTFFRLYKGAQRILTLDWPDLYVKL